MARSAAIDFAIGLPLLQIVALTHDVLVKATQALCAFDNALDAFAHRVFFSEFAIRILGIDRIGHHASYNCVQWAAFLRIALRSVFTKDLATQ